MATTIGTSNVAAERVRMYLGRLDGDLAKVTQRLSTGLKVPLDTPGETGIGDQFELQIRGLRASGVNIQNGSSLMSVADVALSEISDMLINMSELAVQAADGTLTNAQRAPLDTEFQQSKTNINSVANTTSYKGIFLIKGTGGTVNVQVGIDPAQVVGVDFTINYTTAGILSGLPGLDLTTQVNAQTAVANLPGIQSTFGTKRATTSAPARALSALGLVNGQAQVEAFASKSSYVDADIAQEASNLVRDQLRQTAGAAALQVANFSASAIVNLLSGIASRAAAQ